MEILTQRVRGGPVQLRPLFVNLYGGGATLVITENVGRKLVTTGYYVQPLRTDFGIGFRLTKFQVDGGDVFDVCLDGERSLCSCLGFESHGRPCKHVQTLQALVDKGQLGRAA
jgi:hypothetical protein